MNKVNGREKSLYMYILHPSSWGFYRALDSQDRKKLRRGSLSPFMPNGGSTIIHCFSYLGIPRKKDYTVSALGIKCTLIHN